MSKELIERLREAAAQRVASTAMIGAADLSVAADVLEQTEAARMAAISRLCEAEVACATACQERDALAAELKALREQAPAARIDDDENFQGPCRHAMAFVPMHRGAPLYAHPVPARELTDEDIIRMYRQYVGMDFLILPEHYDAARAIERHLRGDAP